MCLSHKAHLAPGGAHRPLPVPRKRQKHRNPGGNATVLTAVDEGTRGGPGRQCCLLAKVLGLGPVLQNGAAFAPGLLAQPGSPQLRRTGAGDSIGTADERRHLAPVSPVCRGGAASNSWGLLFPPHCAAQSSLWLRGPHSKTPPRARLGVEVHPWRHFPSPQSGVAHADTEPPAVQAVADVSFSVEVFIPLGLEMKFH